MAGRSRATSPIRNCGPSATIAQPGSIICASATARRNPSGRCTSARSTSIPDPTRSASAACWNGRSARCAGRKIPPTAPPTRSCRWWPRRRAAPDFSATARHAFRSALTNGVGPAGSIRAAHGALPTAPPRRNAALVYRILAKSQPRPLAFAPINNGRPTKGRLNGEDTMTKPTKDTTSTRRRFLAAAAAGTAAVAAPTVVKAQGPISMRWQSTWPSKDIFHEFAQDYAKKVNDMTGGDLKIEVLPAGAVVPAFGLLDAVSKGVLDGGHGVLVYHYGKQTALALWGSGPGFAMDANMLMAWHKYGGGKELLAKLYDSVGANVVSFPYGPMPTQPLGWFKKPVAKVDDLKGLKFRTVGISIDVFTALGAAVNALPGGEIVAAMDRGLLDAAEFNNATSDRILGFPDVSKVCMLQSYHQNAEQFEIMFNKAKFDALPARMRAIIENAVEASSQDLTWKAIDRYSQDYVELKTKDKVRFFKTPDALLQKQLELYDEIALKKAGENPLFKEIMVSQLAFARRAARWEQDTVVPRKMAFDHYFGPNAKPIKL